MPVLFYQPGMPGFEQALPVETVDILPTLAALIRLPVPAAEIDGRCIDLQAGGDSLNVNRRQAWAHSSQRLLSIRSAGDRAIRNVAVPPSESF